MMPALAGGLQAPGASLSLPPLGSNLTFRAEAAVPVSDVCTGRALHALVGRRHVLAGRVDDVHGHGGGQRIAMRKDNLVYDLLTDHVRSANACILRMPGTTSLVLDAAGNKVACVSTVSTS